MQYNVKPMSLAVQGIQLINKQPGGILNIFNIDQTRIIHTGFFDAEVSVKSDLNLEGKEFQITLKGKLL